MDSVKQWRSIPIWPGYEVSNHGEIRRTFVTGRGHRPRILKGWVLQNGGYIMIGVKRPGCPKEDVGLHRLVCWAFHGAPPSSDHEVAHWNGVATDNRPENLRWVTRKENAVDRERHGNTLRGKRHARNKLTAEMVAQMREQANRGIGQRAIAAALGIHQATVSRVLLGKRSLEGL